MKKLITALMVSLFALSVYAANNEKLAEVVGIEYGSMILEVENNDLKVLELLNKFLDKYVE